MSNQIRFSYVAAASLMAVVLIVLFTTQASRTVASADATVKIAVIDTEKILLSSVTGKVALANLKKLQEALENEVKMMQQEIKDLQTKIHEGRQSLSQDQLAQLQKQLDDKLTALRRKQDDATRDLNKKRDEVLAEIDKKVMPVLNQIGKEMGYTAIFRKFESGLIYADEAIDITAVVIQRLDAGGSLTPLRNTPSAPTSSPDISASGNVGIATASPDLRLDVEVPNATTSFSNTLTYAAGFGNVSNKKVVIGYDQTGQDIGLIQSVHIGTGFKNLALNPNGGNVGVGTTAPTDALSVSGNASKSAGGTSWAVFSDERLKNIKGRFSLGLKAVMQLQPLRFEYKQDNALGLKAQGEEIGFGAQSLQKVIPEAVTRNSNGYLMVKSDPILWTMLNAIKEQQKEIAELKGQVRKLQTASGRRRE